MFEFGKFAFEQFDIIFVLVCTIGYSRKGVPVLKPEGWGQQCFFDIFFRGGVNTNLGVE